MEVRIECREVDANTAIVVLNPQTVWPVDTKGPVKDGFNEKLLNPWWVPNLISNGFGTALNSVIKAISKIDFKKCKT